MIADKPLIINKNTIKLILIASASIGIAISYSDFYLFHLVISILGLLWIINFKENKYKLDISLLSKKHIRILIPIFAWYLLSLFWAPSLELGLKYIFYIFCGIVILLNVVSFSKNINNLNKIFNVLSYLIIFEIIIGLFESFSTFRMPISSYSPFSVFF